MHTSEASVVMMHTMEASVVMMDIREASAFSTHVASRLVFVAAMLTIVVSKLAADSF